MAILVGGCIHKLCWSCSRTDWLLSALPTAYSSADAGATQRAPICLAPVRNVQ